MDEELMNQILGASGMGEQARSIEEQKALANQLRARMLAPPQARSPGAALGGLGAALINGVSLGRYQQNDQLGQAALNAQRQGILSKLPGSVPPAQARVLQRALTATQDPSLMAVGKGYEGEALANEKDDLQHQRLVTSLTATGMKLDEARRIADRQFYRPAYVNTPGDEQHSGVVTQVGPDGKLIVTPQGKAKPPSTGGFGTSTIPLEDAAIDAAADLYETSGGTSMGKISVRDVDTIRRVLNRHGQKYPRSELAGNAAGYKAGSRSLADLTVTRNRLGAFHETLKKNIGVLEGYFNKIPDSDVMPINAMERYIGTKLGDADLAGFAAARNAVSVEAARILYNPNLTGQLTNQAKNDLEAVHSGNYSVAQLREVLKVIRQDADNRLNTMDEQIKGVQKSVTTPRTSALPRATGAAPATATATGNDPLGIR